MPIFTIRSMLAHCG